VRITEKGLAEMHGQEYDDSPVRGEWCLYGLHDGVYIFRCATTAAGLLEMTGREPNGYNRAIRMHGEMRHTHDGEGDCIPAIAPYKTMAGNKARTEVYRSICAGNTVEHI
jgi:hypothetical protein